MGVPAFYRWISEKYPKIVSDMLERRAGVVDGTIIALNLNEPNPNGTEYDNLYVDMNGLIHPCSHPEDREAPKSEEEMYENVTKYLDRLLAAVRPRRLLYLAIDGVAPRAKMNQQRSRRFRAARDADEKKSMMKEVVHDMAEMGYDAAEAPGGEAWDSNVITPGTDFMFNLSIYLRYYILDRMNKDPFWRGLKVVLSDANEPGEGEHKIMNYVRSQRNQPGFDPNQRHILHGLDADLIMLALATHEAHFSILREKVTFGRQDRDRPSKSDAQRMLDQQNVGESIGKLRPQDEWVYSKPLQVLHVSILREYLDNEFSVLHYSLPFRYDLERVIDDFIFLCFFVGNDFLPHLPCLDIRDGALDFLIECYKELLPSLGEYVTSPGGNLNLRQADIILGKVGEMESQIFAKKKAAEEANERRQEQYRQRGRGGGGGRGGGDNRGQGQPNNGAVAVVPLSRVRAALPTVAAAATHQPQLQQVQAAKDNHRYIPMGGEPSAGGSHGSGGSQSKESNSLAASRLKSLLGKRHADPEVPAESEAETVSSLSAAAAVVVEEAAPALTKSYSTATLGENDSVVTDPAMEVDAALAGIDASAQVKDEIKRRLKEKEQSIIDRNRETIVDTVKLHEEGGKERYYNEPFKKENIEAGGGLARLCRTYVQGLCWVLRYYYHGVPSWNWYYPFHYAPLASDLVNIDLYEGMAAFDLAAPFRPVEQLLAVLPANSVHALPTECHWLMLDPASPIIDLYNGDVPIDPNGQHLPWLWILLLPFIDESRIMAAFKQCQPNLDLFDRRKNALGGSFVYLHSTSPVGREALQAMAYSPGQETDADVLEGLKLEKEALGEADGGEGASIAVETPADGTAEQTYTFDATLGAGMSGTLEPAHPSGFVRLNAPVRAHTLATRGPCADVTSNAVLCFNYRMPAASLHRSEVLRGVVFQESILTQHDLQPRRPPRLNKAGFNVLELYNQMRGVNERQRYVPQNQPPQQREYVLTGQFQERQSFSNGRDNRDNRDNGRGSYNNDRGGYNNNNNQQQQQYGNGGGGGYRTDNFNSGFGRQQDMGSNVARTFGSQPQQQQQQSNYGQNYSNQGRGYDHQQGRGGSGFSFSGQNRSGSGSGLNQQYSNQGQQGGYNNNRGGGGGGGGGGYNNGGGGGNYQSRDQYGGQQQQQQPQPGSGRGNDYGSNRGGGGYHQQQNSSQQSYQSFPQLGQLGGQMGFQQGSYPGGGGAPQQPANMQSMREQLMRTLQQQGSQQPSQQPQQQNNFNNNNFNNGYR